MSFHSVQVEGGWLLNGKKRWIGNSTFADIIIIYARNMETSQVHGCVTLLPHLIKNALVFKYGILSSVNLSEMTASSPCHKLAVSAPALLLRGLFDNQAGRLHTHCILHSMPQLCRANSRCHEPQPTLFCVFSHHVAVNSLSARVRQPTRP